MTTEVLTAETPAPSPETLKAFEYRGRGKVARLPKSVREQINQWLLDGDSYSDIIARLGEHGKNLSPKNIHEWKKRGHQDWLLKQDWIAHIRTRQEPASDLSLDYDATQLNHAALQLGGLHIFEALRDLGPSTHPTPLTIASLPGADQAQPHPAQPQRSRSTLDLRLGGDSAAFVRLMNALARMTRETTLLQKYREACAKACAAMQPLLDPNRELTLQERRALVREVDKILGLNPDEHRLEVGKGGLVSFRLDNCTNEPPPPANDSPPANHGETPTPAAPSTNALTAKTK